jgi:hypothetical protein
VRGQLLPGGWHLGEREATAVASVGALEAEPSLAEIHPDTLLPGGGIDAPDTPFGAIAVREDP